MNEPATKISLLKGFRIQPAIDFDPGITRRDPSPVIRVDGRYHMWYSKNAESDDGFTATIYHATSSDGLAWQEQEQAIDRGGPGAFDECGVFTPGILIAQGRYWMSYTAMPAQWRQAKQTTKGAIGMAVADSPDGPWEKVSDEPILRCSDDPAAFDSLRVDDTCFVVRDGRYWMYYKGRQWGKTPAETKAGVAIADHPAGPYVKHERSPVLSGGHEVCVWPEAGGVSALISTVGPIALTTQHSRDGLVFQTTGKLAQVPHAPGPYRDDVFADGASCSMAWGVAIGGTGYLGEEKTSRPYLLRWEAIRE